MRILETTDTAHEKKNADRNDTDAKDSPQDQLPNLLSESNERNLLSQLVAGSLKSADTTIDFDNVFAKNSEQKVSSDLLPASRIDRVGIFLNEAGKAIIPAAVDSLIGIDHVSIPFSKALTGRESSLPVPKAAETLAIGAAINFAARTLLPQTGVWGKVAAFGLGATFALPLASQSMKISSDVYNADSISELRKAGHELGTTVGNIAASIPIGIAGYKVGGWAADGFNAAPAMSGFVSRREAFHDSVNRKMDNGISWTAEKLKEALGTRPPENFTGSHLMAKQMLERTPAGVNVVGMEYTLPNLPKADPSMLKGKEVVIMTTHGAEAPEVLVPFKYLKESGANVRIATQDWVGQYQPKAANQVVMARFLDPNLTVKADMGISQAIKLAEAGKVDALIIPGGAWNPAMLRTDAKALELVDIMSRTNKLIASICHGPQVLIDAAAQKGIFPKGTNITGVADIRTDLRNAGWKVIETEPTVFDAKSNLLTSRDPNDLGPFTLKIIEHLTGAKKAN